MLNDNCTLGRNDDFPLENFKRGTRVWIKDPDKVWVIAELVDDLTFACSVIRVQKSEEVCFLNVLLSLFAQTPKRGLNTKMW